MNGFIDLHTHSVCSDGALRPAEVVKTAKEAGLRAMALSDHDSVEGVAEAVDEGRKIGVEVVPAIELSVQSDTETHILGYYLNTANRTLLAELEKAKQVRYRRQQETCEKLQGLGFDVTMAEAEAIAPSGVVCRAHFARLLTDKGYCASPKEAFTKWLDCGKAAYSGLQYFTPAQGVRLIKQAGGLAFVAHLHLIKLADEPLREFIESLIPEGLDGIEGYYTDYTPQMQDKYQALAAELGLLISGGTDFHGANKPHISIGKGLGNLQIPYSVLESIKARKGI